MAGYPRYLLPLGGLFAALLLTLPSQTSAAVGAGASGGLIQMVLGNELLALFVVIAAGMALGRVNLAGLSLGSSAVIFTALALGYLGYTIPGGVGQLGLVLFLYCVGIAAGPRFFRVFVRRGKQLALLAVALVLAAGSLTWVLARAFGIPGGLVVGVFAGAMTSTPALAAAMEALPGDFEVAVGYGLAYPFGVISVVLFVQLLPRLLANNMKQLLEQAGPTEDDKGQVVRALVEVINPAVIGKQLHELEFLTESNCLVSRVLQGQELVPLVTDLTLEQGQLLLILGREQDLERMVQFLGRRSDRTDCVLETEHHTQRVVVTSRNVVGHTLAELKLRNRFGVSVSRMTCHGHEFVPRPHMTIEHGIQLMTVGEPEDLERFSEFAGHRAQAYDETDLISVSVGIVAGVLLGMVTFSLGGATLSLGKAGGPLLVALVLGHYGRIGPVAGHLPRASRMLMQELGLVFFLAAAGVNAGEGLMPVLRQHSAGLLVAAAAIASLPMLAGYLFARYALRMDLLQILGGICGGMTSTPGLGVLMAKIDSESPVMSYAAVYPVALILLTICARSLVLLLM